MSCFFPSAGLHAECVPVLPHCRPDDVFSQRVWRHHRQHAHQERTVLWHRWSRPAFLPAQHTIRKSPITLTKHEQQTLRHRVSKWRFDHCNYFKRDVVKIIKQKESETDRLTSYNNNVVYWAPFALVQAQCWDCVHPSNLCFAQSDRLLAASCMWTTAFPP